jgi:hypothetical protein
MGLGDPLPAILCLIGVELCAIGAALDRIADALG